MLIVIRSLAFLCLLIICTSSTTTVRSQAPPPTDDSSPPILDTSGNPLERGIEYYILPGETPPQNGGFTLVDRNGSCPLYVGQDQSASSQGFPVIFTPFNEGDAVVRESRDFRIVFSAASICVQSTAWTVSGTENINGRRLIVAGGGDGYSGYFRINRNGEGGYSMGWCPTDVCPICRFICGDVGVLVENGKLLLALDGDALAVVFQKV